MNVKEDILNELNAWAAGRQKEQTAAASEPLLLLEPATAADVDATLAKCATEELRRIVDVAGPLPMVAWRYLTADQRRALRAQNLLVSRETAAQQAHDTRAAQIERQAVAARQQRAAQTAAENAPLLQKKRDEYSRGW